MASEVTIARIMDGSLIVRIDTPNSEKMPVCSIFRGRFGMASASADQLYIGAIDLISANDNPPGA